MNKTGIEWTDFSSNPLYVVDKETGKRGWFCEKVSPGCANCYASALNVRRGTGHVYLPANRDKVEWRLNERELQAILRRRKPTRIFMCDMTDLFHEDVPDVFLQQVFVTMEGARRHTFQVLTKRPERMRQLLTDGAFRSGIESAFGSWPLPNVHLGVSVENQRMADERIPMLLDTPAAVRFLSCEPLLGPLDVRRWMCSNWPYHEAGHGCGGRGQQPRISWVIVGGETGPGSAERKLVERCDHRFGFGGVATVSIDPPDCCPGCHGTGWRPKPQALEWVRSLRDQCVAAGVAFFFKQWGGRTPTSGGRLLDGREWDEMPETMGA